MQIASRYRELAIILYITINTSKGQFTLGGCYMILYYLATGSGHKFLQVFQGWSATRMNTEMREVLEYLGHLISGMGVQPAKRLLQLRMFWNP
jgi:hypothetical protein